MTLTGLPVSPGHQPDVTPKPVPTPAPTPGGAAAGDQLRGLGLPEFGVQFHGVWSDYTERQRVTTLNLLRDAGVDRVRIDVSWAMLQPSGPNSFDQRGVDITDQSIRLATARGLRPVVTLWLTPEWANGGRGERALPDDSADYGRVARWLASRYRGQVAAWEVWNEPDDPAFMAGADPAEYTRLLRAAYPQFHAGDPCAQVVFGGTKYNNDRWIGAAYRAGAAGSFDIMATHAYQVVANLPPEAPDVGTTYTIRHVAAVRDVMVRNGDGGKPIWFTEFGWSAHRNGVGTDNWALGVSQIEQADYLVRTVRLLAAEYPYVRAVFWYNERDKATGNLHEDSYGLLHRDLTPKPAYWVLRGYLAARPR